VLTRTLGSHGPAISVLGFGSWAVGGPWRFGWGPTDDGAAVAAIRRAVEGGANWVDTAPVYGVGHSEEIVGRALEPYRVGEEVLVFTKCGRRWREDGQIYSDLRPETIRAECDESLRRLSVDRIDLYQFHWPDRVTGTQVEESWGVMGELVEEGKARWLGVANFDVELLERCERVRHVDSVQPPLSLLSRHARLELIPWCAANGSGVVVYSPMASGLLTGTVTRERLAALPADDFRRSAAPFQEPKLSQNLAFVDRARAVAERLGTTLPELAIAWTLTIPGVTGAIVGARRPEQVDGWLGAPAVVLDDAASDELERALEETGAGVDTAPSPPSE
jgi:aryl-alcohol dehydrogenase-like predicted oxidoreductase